MLHARFSNVFTIDICIEFNIDIDIDIDIEYDSNNMLKKKKQLVSQLATLNRFNVLQVHLVRVLLEQVLSHAKKNLASRNKPDCVIWLDMHVFHCILEQRS